VRLGGNSFSIKGWAVALIAVLGGFAAKDADPRFVLGLWLPLICFWGLDAFYLRQERLFRELYHAAVNGEESAPLYSMNTKPFESKVGRTAKAAFSPTILWLYIPILVFVLALSFYALHRVRAGQSEKAAVSVKATDSVKQTKSPSGAPSTPAASEPKKPRNK